MNYCTECRAIEGKWREPTEAERREYGIADDEDVSVCAECDSVDTLKRIPEHDDWGMER